ncbi:hypothetical protein COO60DRAFT_708974 [Scenedesmus sp. NREL 46B-D3]|nr:hypothetical protein COO60DRAFT_708974 [Scenedesmus sp. NREL 46B-D3]
MRSTLPPVSAAAMAATSAVLTAQQLNMRSTGSTSCCMQVGHAAKLARASSAAAESPCSAAACSCCTACSATAAAPTLSARITISTSCHCLRLLTAFGIWHNAARTASAAGSCPAVSIVRCSCGRLQDASDPAALPELPLPTAHACAFNGKKKSCHLPGPKISPCLLGQPDDRETLTAPWARLLCAENHF